MPFDLETSTQQIGRELFARDRENSQSYSPLGRLDDALMNWTMRDPVTKAHLLRFVDVLSALDSPAQVMQHLREYAGGAGIPFARHIPQTGLGATLLSRLAHWTTRRMGRRFIAAGNLQEAIAIAKALAHQGLLYTIDLLGEAVVSEAEARQYQRTYLDLIDGLTRHSSGVNVSIKLSALYSQFDPIAPVHTSQGVRDRLRPILKLARDRGAFVNIDMEQYAFKDATLAIVKEIFDEPEFRDWPNAGVAMQAYLHDTAADLESLEEWARARGTPIWVRLVKGAYWDYETVIAAQNNWPLPVFSQKHETDANFESLTTFLLERTQYLRPAIASHNIRSIAHALAEARRLDIPRDHVEFQMLHGMADPIKASLVQMGQTVRVYAPMGRLLPGMAYLVRRLLENTSNESFLRAGFYDHVPEEQLLMNPLKLAHRPPAAPHPPAFTNEPLADFSMPQPRQEMQKALSELKLGRQEQLLIDGRRLAGGGTIESVDPSHRNRIVCHCAAASAQQAHDAIASAKRAFFKWRDVGVEERAAMLNRAAEIMRRRRWELAAWEVVECAKPWREADADVAEAIDYCDYYAQQMRNLANPRHRDVPGEENAYFYEPRGVAVIIAPWNFPLAILCGMTAAAVVTGNTAIMKPAEQSVAIGARLMEVFEQAGAPPGVVNFLPGIGEKIGPVLVGDPDVSVIAFTGSRAVGLSINETASRTLPKQNHVKHIIAEMGGKNAIIVDDDADLDEAVLGTAHSAFGYAGQKCSAASRVIVLESIHDAFVARLIEATRSLRIGPAEDPATFIPPVIDADAQSRILRTIEKGKTEARMAFQAEIDPSLKSAGFYVPPTIFTDVPESSSLATEEIFGPVLSVLRARNLDHAIELANATPYALTGGLYSRRPSAIERIRREFRVGNLYINRKITGALVDRQPFGGFKLSGLGSKAGGPDYLQHFLWPRTITENTLRRGFAPTE